MTDHVTRAPELYGWRSDQYLITMDSAEAAESGIEVFTVSRGTWSGDYPTNVTLTTVGVTVSLDDAYRKIERDRARIPGHGHQGEERIMSNTDPWKVIYGTMCDMVQEIIGTERIIREAIKADPRSLAMWEGERGAMMRAVSHVASGGRDGSGRYNAAFTYLDERIRQVTSVDDLPPSGTVVIDLRAHLVERFGS